jgi:FkbM family methyltransferase
MISFYSQNNQDEFCYKNFFKNKKEGVFVEIGCLNGIKFSNTFVFEQMGWTGICVEASPSNFELLKNNRNCICENYAVTPISGQKMSFMDIHGYGEGLSGLVEKYDSRHKQRIKRELKNNANKGYDMVEVETINFNDLLDTHNIHNIDLCSIDTEGGEFEIVESIDFSKNKIEVLLVENNYRDQRFKSYLTKLGFLHIGALGADEVYKFEKQN